MQATRWGPNVRRALLIYGARSLLTATDAALPPAQPESPAPGVTAFRGGEAPGYTWYFFPRLLQAPSGELLVFSEAHKDCRKVSDRGWIDIVMKRSADGGKTWSPVEVVHSEYEKTPGTWIGNPAPVIDLDTSTLWLVMSRNNTDVLVMHSQDWGKSWSKPTVISDQVLAPEWRSKPSWQDGWGWVAPTGALQLKSHGGRLLVVGDIQTPATPNCSSPYSVQRAYRGLLGIGNGDGTSCSQSWAMFSDTHGKTWNYSRTLMLPGDEVSNPAELSNGSVIINMRGHDLSKYDKGDPNNAIRWLARSDDGGTTWPSDFSHMRPLINGSSSPRGETMHFGGDCFGDMTAVPAVGATKRRAVRDSEAARKDLLVMAAIYEVGGNVEEGRSDYRVHRSLDGGDSWTQVAQVYPGSASYSGITALNSTHVGVMYNAGSSKGSSMACDAVTQYVVLCVRCQQLESVFV